jgi:hypothetical protein
MGRRFAGDILMATLSETAPTVHAELAAITARVRALQADAGSTDLETRMAARSALPAAMRQLDELTLACIKADREAEAERDRVKASATAQAHARLKTAVTALAAKLRPLQPLADELAAANDALAVVAGEHAVDRSLAWPRLESATPDARELVAADCPSCQGSGKIRVDKEDVACADCRGTGHEPTPWRLAQRDDRSGLDAWLASARLHGLLDE